MTIENNEPRRLERAVYTAGTIAGYVGLVAAVGLLVVNTLGADTHDVKANIQLDEQTLEEYFSPTPVEPADIVVTDESTTFPYNGSTYELPNKIIEAIVDMERGMCESMNTGVDVCDNAGFKIYTSTDAENPGIFYRVELSSSALLADSGTVYAERGLIFDGENGSWLVDQSLTTLDIQTS